MCSPWACTEAETSFLTLESSRSKQAVTAGTGTVRDLPGRPVPGEAVFAVVFGFPEAKMLGAEADVTRGHLGSTLSPHQGV